MGWAVTRGGKLVAGGTAILKGKNTESAGMRFLRARNTLKDLLAIHQPDIVCYEAVKRFMSSASALVYNGILAQLLVLCEETGDTYLGVSPKEIKKHATGNGNAKKEDIIAWAQNYYSTSVKDDNHADALAICYYADSMIHNVQTKPKLL
jgi:Holliday junction resolvasome RuvABC endonuclease subunit